MVSADFTAWFVAQLDELEEQYGEDLDIRTVVLHVEVDGPEDTTIVTRSTEDRGWVIAAFMDQAADLVHDAMHPVGDDD